jgi:hypothetical protein
MTQSSCGWLASLRGWLAGEAAEPTRGRGHGRLWADSVWTASGERDSGAASVPARGFKLWFCSAGWGTIRGQRRTQWQNFDERQAFFFLQKGSHDWLSSFDRHRSALLSGLHGKADCTGYIAIKLSCIHALHSRGLLVISVRFFFLIST